MADETRRYHRLIIGGKLKGFIYFSNETSGPNYSGNQGGAQPDPNGTANLANVKIPVVFKDISKSGMGMFCASKYPLQKILRIVIEGCPFPALEGRIVWSGAVSPEENAPASMGFRLGVDFLPRDDEARDVQLSVYQFIANLMNQ